MPGTTSPAGLKSVELSGAVWHKLLALGLLLWGLGGCARPEPTLVVTVGGLGFSQMGDLRHAVKRECPQAKVVSAGAWDAYKADIKAIATAKPHEHIILIGHIFGCPAIAQAAEKLPNVDLLVFIDPAWSDFRMPSNVPQYLWYRRSGIGLEREARIIGAATSRTIKGGHNDIPHAPELIAGVVQAINHIDSRRSASGGRPMASGPRDPDSGF